jgi:phosphatidate phosphatase APP1
MGSASSPVSVLQLKPRFYPWAPPLAPPDVDDTIKVSNVLDKLKLLKATFLDDPVPVAGMPELYKKLKGDLGDPAFFYVTGSPFQLYPFLRGFIGATYPRGPIMPKNLTFVDVPGVIKAIGLEGTQQFKDAMVDRIHGFYPKKTFVAIGDSTERDPETYGDS